MDANARTPRDLLDGNEHYEIPAFQRPYVWNEEDQWAPLWDDIVRVADSRVRAGDGVPAHQHHFLGAVVYETRASPSGDVNRHDVIDGQQRMTTLQLLIDAVHEIVLGRGHDDVAEGLEELVLNRPNRFRGKRERFKLWPSNSDRAAFAHAMDPREPWNGGEHRVLDAHRFFREEAERWIVGEPDEDGSVPPGTETDRVEALSTTLQSGLVLVAIDLTGHDDSQLIFETLNDRGTPLLKADLIKNWLFRKGEQAQADVDGWADGKWAEFDDVWWREEIRQGRLIRSRIDIFLQYWLTMRLQDEVKADQVFRDFVTYAEPRVATASGADTLLNELRADADVYRGFAQLEETTPEGRFYRYVIELMELAATTPVFLWLLSPNHGVGAEQRRTGLAALESWVMRRTLLRRTSKDVNRFMVATLKELGDADPGRVGERIVEYLAEQTADSREWPSDEEMMAELPYAKLYGNIRQGRLRVVLRAAEKRLRAANQMYESATLPEGLEIEHVMPQGWRSHWDPEPKLTPEQASQRDRMVNTIGNLTLVTKSLNGSLSNRPWTDASAVDLREGGEAGRGKRSLLDKFSLLALNREITHEHVDSWTEGSILERSRRLVKLINDEWPGPDPALKRAAQMETHEPELSEDEVPWTSEDIERLAAEVGLSLGQVLDAFAARAGEWVSGRELAAAGVTKNAGAQLGALAMKARGSFGRPNVPVQYKRTSGAWHWMVSADFADSWANARAKLMSQTGSD